MIRKIYFAVIGALLLLYGGWTVRGGGDVEGRAARVPRMTCDELARNGPGGNTYVTLTDVKVCTGGSLFYRDGLSPGHVEETVPVYAAGRGREPEPRDLALVLQVFDDEQRQHILRRPEVGELTCEVRRAPGWLDPEDLPAIESKYPGLRVDRCWVLGVGLCEPTAARARQMKWQGTCAAWTGVALLAGVWLWAAHERRRAAPASQPPAGGGPAAGGEVS
jgi:hypothetical protein